MLQRLVCCQRWRIRVRTNDASCCQLHGDYLSFHCTMLRRSARLAQRGMRAMHASSEKGNDRPSSTPDTMAQVPRVEASAVLIDGNQCVLVPDASHAVGSVESRVESMTEDVTPRQRMPSSHASNQRFHTVDARTCGDNRTENNVFTMNSVRPSSHALAFRGEFRKEIHRIGRWHALGFVPLPTILEEPGDDAHGFTDGDSHLETGSACLSSDAPRDGRKTMRGVVPQKSTAIVRIDDQFSCHRGISVCRNHGCPCRLTKLQLSTHTSRRWMPFPSLSHECRPVPKFIGRTKVHTREASCTLSSWALHST